MGIHKKILILSTPILLILLYLILKPASSQTKNDLPAITVINLIRSKELGHEKDNLAESLKAQWKVTNDSKVKATWLWQYSSLEDKDMTSFAKTKMFGHEFGLLFEIDRNLAKKSGVQYRGQGPSYFSDGMLLVSYDVRERQKLIDTSFSKFKNTFGYYPKTVGAWWIGGDSLLYMQKRYGITAALKASDQFNLDVYTIWGAPWSIPYVASKENEGIPGSSLKNSSKVVILQWAARDPTQGYKDPLFSIQDYQIKGYDISYVDYLSSIFLSKPLGNLVFGLENGGSLQDFEGYYKRMLNEAKKLESIHKARIMLVKDYTGEFLAGKKVFSQNHYFLSIGYKLRDQSFWYNSENYRAGVLKNSDVIYLIDLRNYSVKTKEDFFILPNSQGNLYADVPAIIDSVRFPDSKILIGKSSSIMEIKENSDQITLLAGGKKIASFTPSNLEIFLENGKTKIFNFKNKDANINIFHFLLGIYLIYFVLTFRRGNLSFRRGNLFQNALLFVPLFLAYPFLPSGSINNLTFIMDKKQLLLFSPFVNPLFLSPLFVVFIVVLPFIILISLNYIFVFKKYGKATKTIYYLFLGFLILFFSHIPYFPLDKSTYKTVLMIFFLIFITALIFGFILFRKKKSKKTLINILLITTLFLAISAVTILFSRSKIALTSFEMDALQLIKNKQKDVLYVSQVDYNIKPIYKAVRPFVYENYNLSEKITNVNWQEVKRPKNDIINLSNFKNKIIVVQRYLGADLSDYEAQRLGLNKIFDNAQVAIFEKNK